MVRSADNPKTRDLAQWLLVYEAAAGDSSTTDTPVVYGVCDKLRRPLSTLAGAAGFRSLLARFDPGKAGVPGPWGVAGQGGRLTGRCEWRISAGGRRAHRPSDRADDYVHRRNSHTAPSA